MHLILSTLTKPRTSLIHNVCEVDAGDWRCQDGFQKLVASREESASLDGMVPNMAIIALGSISQFKGDWRLF